MEFLSCKHDYAGGDLISILPGLRHVYKETGKKWIIYQRIDYELFYYEGMIPATVNDEGKAVSMNRKHFEMLKPLLLAQDYIEDFIEWKGEKCDIDMAKSRDSRSIPMPYVPLHQLPFLIAPELQCDLSEPWLNVPRFNLTQQIENKILINRTQRYTNPNVHYYFLKQYEPYLMFAGTEKEHDLFCRQWDLSMNRLIINDFSELSYAISACQFLICNQSLCFHIADALKSKRVLEMCSVFPNTFPTGVGGATCLYQESLELNVYKYFNK